MTASSEVRSNQTDIHPDLNSLIRKHLKHPYKKPIGTESSRIFTRLLQCLEGQSQPLILDSGCGTGDSSIKLSNQFPDHLIIGADKSAHRLGKYLQQDEILQQGNLLLVRIDLIDLWRLAVAHGWQLARHYLYYPNPWPKKKHLQRRWHAHPAFPSLLALGGRLQLRTNWVIFHREFALALQLMDYAEIQQTLLDIADPVSPFEKKYKQSGHHLYQTVVELN